MRRRFFSLLTVLLLGLNFGCQQQKVVETVHLSGRTMGTTWSVALLPAPQGTDPAALKQQLQARLDQINRLMSTYDPQSEVSRFNHQASRDWFAVSAETAQVIALAQKISALSNGAFDISVDPLVELWGFGATVRKAHIPSAEQIRAARARVGYQNIRLRHQPAAIRKMLPELRIDLSAIAKGYAVDALAELLRQQQISNYLVEVGGELQIAGHRSDNTPWRIAIEKPLAGSREVAAIFPLTDTALATSGDYRNFYVEDGRRYAHTIDPATGRPVQHRLVSVTVLDRSCARADALATALMVMGEKKGRRFCEQNRIAAYFFIQQKETLVTYASPAFQTFVAKEKK